MKHLLHRSLLVLFVLALAAPAFPCDYCAPMGWCLPSDSVNTFCIEDYDFCTDYNGCSTVADQTRLADTLTIASVEVVTPFGMTQTNASPSLALAR